MECTHLLDNVKLDELKVEDARITKNFNCAECSVPDQNWLCLHCGAVHCGRYINGHAKIHAQTQDHQLCISCDVYSVYCYKCDDYVSNDLEQQTIDKIRKSIMNIRNDNGVEGNGNMGQSEENSKDGSEASSGSSASVIGKPASPVSSGEDIRVDVTPNSSNDMASTITKSESKPSKSVKNVDEPVRSLRPRSRKRTHSDDSSSTENNTTQTSRNKGKKISPCNGRIQREKRIVGLKNLGNTCFMNAVLQSLNNIQEFSCYISQLPSLETKPNGRKVYHSRSYTRQEMHDVVMAEELRKVLINLNTGGCGSKAAISPECLFLVIWKVVPRFRGYQQQDAHEFLRYMLDRLHTELQQLLPVERAAPSPASSPTTSPTTASTAASTAAASIVTAVFGGTLQSEVRCLACGTRSKKLDPFLDLSLELPDPRASTPASGRDALSPPHLNDCLASFVQVEELADTERYFCSSCKCKQKSTKQFWIRRLPNVLCLHLKRFRWHNYFRTKVDTCISFPLRALDMSRFVPSGAGGAASPASAANAASATNAASGSTGAHLYDLAAVIVHHGSGAGSGHYTAFAINEDQWFHFNDQTVRATDSAAVAGCKPYILFYIRRELTLPAS